MSAFVMVIDDSLVMRKIVEVCLNRAGYPVKSFPAAEKMFHWLETAEACIPPLVLVDACFPGKLDGYDIIVRLRARPAFARTVFVMISGCNGILDRLKARIAGAKDYLTKPFKTEELLAVVQTYLGVASLRDEEALDMERSLKEGRGSGLLPVSMHEQSLQRRFERFQGRERMYG